METITVTRWELGFLRTLAAPVQAVAAWSERLDIPDIQPDSDLAAAGFSSLLLRDLARVDGDGVVVAPELASTLIALSTASDVATMVAASEGGADAAHVFIGGEQSVLVRPRAFGTFEVSGLSDDATLVALLALFAEAGDGDSTMVASVQDGPEIAVRRQGPSFTVEVGASTSTTDRNGLDDCLASLMSASTTGEVAGG